MTTTNKARVLKSGDAVTLGEPPAGVASAQPAQPLEPVWPADEFTGKPGRFVRDPVTGVRRPADPEEGV